MGLHCLGFVAKTSSEAANAFYPGYAGMVDTIGKERGWPPSSRTHFDAQTTALGAFLIGSPEEVAEKLLRHSQALGGVSRVTFQMDNQSLPHDRLLQSVELIATKVKPAVMNRASQL